MILNLKPLNDQNFAEKIYYFKQSFACILLTDW